MLMLVGLSLAYCVPVVWGYHYETRTFEVPVDHFSFANNDTFHLRYLINDTFWRKPDGPIFFYTGNEWNIESFCENTGLCPPSVVKIEEVEINKWCTVYNVKQAVVMDLQFKLTNRFERNKKHERKIIDSLHEKEGFIWEIAPEFKALVVFAEHRYYGHSLPYGNKSFTDPKYSGYLTSQQALADFVDLVKNLTSNQKPGRESSVIAFGGSYGGMLSAYIRIKYPHVFKGAIAASAPIWQFTGLTPCTTFNKLVTDNFKVWNKSCSDLIRRSWPAMNKVLSTDKGKTWLNENWTLCHPLKTQDDIAELKDYLSNMYSNLAMVNYPYAADFLANLPAYPVREFCKQIQGPSNTDEIVLTTLFRGISLYFNFTGNASCFNHKEGDSDVGGSGWNYQSCTEMVMPICSDGVGDMFERMDWDIDSISKTCDKQFKVKPDPYIIEKIYGGKNIKAASNIIFSNGLLDPWSGGGVLKSLSKRLISVLIPEGAHHIDLRGKHADDPASVTMARDLYRLYIRRWIESDNNS